jgi:hypothetical protein
MRKHAITTLFAQAAMALTVSSAYNIYDSGLLAQNMPHTLVNIAAGAATAMVMMYGWDFLSRAFKRRQIARHDCG